MPRSPLDLRLRFAPWVEALYGADLWGSVARAILTRDLARRCGAERPTRARKILRVADRALEAIACGESRGLAAQRKAAAAERSYLRALDGLPCEPCGPRGCGRA